MVKAEGRGTAHAPTVVIGPESDRAEDPQEETRHALAQARAKVGKLRGFLEAAEADVARLESELEARS